MDVVALNRMMIDRLLAEPPRPIAEGECALRVLEVPGRRTGERRRVPVGVLRHQGEDYLVCPDRTRDWPRNLAGHPRCTLLAGRSAEERSGVPVPGAGAAEVVAAYLKAVDAPWVKAAFGLGEEPALAEIEQALPRMAVFHLRP
ncbi:nitroreductase/quinone reductase family protein [Nonomuraea phyllanthi]|uniref:nitroreductase/quinone reductase family protein n=1 Tax=Nonomuraea phyllanthi TaxID=2219224 RepID=UPI001D14B024|nr:nitroreductase/quinone reductase family protein [Nonomuraea phyllanthi]